MSQLHKKKPLKIEPFRHRVEVDPRYAEKTWKVIEDAINEIYNRNASGLSFEELYRNAYNMVLHKYGEHLYKGLTKAMTTNLRKISLAVEEAQGEAILTVLNSKWEDQNKALQMIRDILMYMDRTYVANNQKLPVHELGLQLWRDNVLRCEKIKGRLEETLLECIHKERIGEVIDKSILRNIIKMYAALGPAVYQDDFETPFLSATAEFYKKESQKHIENLHCPTYLKETEKRLQEESQRVMHYVDRRTEEKLTSVVETEMIGNHMKALVEDPNSGLIALIKNNALEDVARMYTLFKRVSHGSKSLLDVLCGQLRTVGKDLVTDPERSNNPVDYVQALLDMKDKYDDLVRKSFYNDKQFQNGVNAAFESFMNLNHRSPEFISLFVDEKLKKGLKGISEEESEEVLDKVVTLFRFLQEKDVFEKYYKQHLAKRLLSGRSVSDDAEKSLIVKLKTECGYQFTSKLEGMFNDMRTSQDATEEFYRAFPDIEGPQMTVQILTTGYWPIQLAPACNLPPELHILCDKFKQRYLGTHTGRRLNWHTNLGSAEVKAHFNRKYELSVSTHQMCVLMLFNACEGLSYKEIEDATDIPALELKRSLQSLALVKGRNVLRKEPSGKDVSETDVFYVNDKFTSKTFKVKIGTVNAQKESEPEKMETRQKVEEDRKPQIEAAIVRIMKARRVLDHNNIISEVTAQLQDRFLPNPAVIKKRIESLIEREFLERDKTDRKLYRYLA